MRASSPKEPPTGSAPRARAGTARGRVGRTRDLAAWIERAAAVTPTPGALAAWAIAFARVAVHLYYAGDFATPDRVLAAVERGIAGLRPRPLVEARLAGALAARAVEASDLDGVERETLRSLRAYERAGDPRNAATQLAVLGIAATRAGRYEEAERWLDASLAHVRRMRLPTGIGMTLRPLAQVYLRRGEVARAIETILEAVTWLGATEHDRLKHVAQIEFAYILFETGDVEGADARAADLLSAHAPAPFLRQFALALRSRAALRHGRVDEALALARESMRVTERDRAIIDSEALASSPSSTRSWHTVTRPRPARSRRLPRRASRCSRTV